MAISNDTNFTIRAVSLLAAGTVAFTSLLKHCHLGADGSLPITMAEKAIKQAEFEAKKAESDAHTAETILKMTPEQVEALKAKYTRPQPTAELAR